ncbi:unnamed protein product [Orchesella dallaii]|uniref:Uncharacterized protein n=1 Tax=Orchesella dallaii TaxID=48710 RepID=A0ABP1QQT6_9HEXA
MASIQADNYRQHLSSLTSHMRKFERPTPHGYDIFATTYISSDIPWNKILSDETDSYTAESLPFITKFEVEQLTCQEQERKLRGESERKRELLSSTGLIIGSLKSVSGVLESFEDKLHLAHLYLKAMQYSEVNKALTLDGKYPKPDSQAIRSTFSKEHQAAAAAVASRKNKEDREISRRKHAETLLQHYERQLVPIPQLMHTSESNRRMASSETQQALRSNTIIKEALGSPSTPKELQLIKEPWQFKAGLERTRIQPSLQRKFPWKKNIYPPKSKEERIAELRKRIPPLRSEHLQTDQLPGLWEPELMCESFQTFQAEIQEKIEDWSTAEGDWWKLFYSNKKCSDWLKAIPDSL